MDLIRKCEKCGQYTLFETCPRCGNKTINVHQIYYSDDNGKGKVFEEGKN